MNQIFLWLCALFAIVNSGPAHAHAMPNSMLVLHREGPQFVAALQSPSRSLAIAPPVKVSATFAPAFMLGMRHLAEGADHILFLLTLILPAPMRRGKNGWDGVKATHRAIRDCALLATAFTAGHALTLTWGVATGTTFPHQPVEVGIALSILLAAACAWRPMPFREALAPLLAGFVGLVHGMGFAGALDVAHSDGMGKVVAIAGFNLGIEAMQMLILLLAVPLVLLLARTRAYDAIRVAGAGLASCTALIWMVARVAN